MGYYTNYTLEIMRGDDLFTDYAKEISTLADYGDCFNDSIKWYSHEEDMIKYSLKHPTTLFKLSGSGEESGDLWVKYFLNGKVQEARAQIVFDEFDESKLM